MTDMAENSLVDRLKEFMEHEARSCLMDFGCITPEYVYRMWGEQAHIKMTGMFGYVWKSV